MLIDQYPLLLIALCLWREARGESTKAQRGILHVILNRAKDNRKRWPNDPIRVILQKAQFSSFSPNDPNAVKLPTPGAAADWRAFQQCCLIVEEPGDDPTGGATGFESEADPVKRAKIAWAKPVKITLTEGPFRFYKL